MTTQTTPQIAGLIPRGHENAIGRRFLITRCIDAGIIEQKKQDKERELRKLVQDARESGTVICNAGDGFFLPTPEDAAYLRHDIVRKEQMAIQILKPLNHSKALLADIEAGRIS